MERIRINNDWWKWDKEKEVLRDVTGKEVRRKGEMYGR